MTHKIASKMFLACELKVRQNVTTNNQGAKLKPDFNAEQSLPPD